MQKKLVMAGVIAAAAIAAPAFAANTIVTTTSGASAAPASATTVLNFNTANASTEAASKGITLTTLGYGGQFSGTTTTGGFTYAAPNPQDGGFYGVGGSTDGSILGSYAQFMGATGQAFSNISVFIGSLDAYNVVQVFYTGGGFDTYDGTQLNGGSSPAFPGGPINVRANFTATNGQTYSGIKFYNNTNQGSLEFDNLAFTTATGAVPEPASWAMMIGGFGMVGGVMRRRKDALRFA